jgi:tagatose-6-phosphate ketose/aldose isomerase
MDQFIWKTDGGAVNGDYSTSILGEGSMKTSLSKLMEETVQEKQKRGTLYTPKEIYGQVDLWESTYAICKNRLSDTRSFIGKLQNNPAWSCILTGAGTSEFIGYCVEGAIRKTFDIPVNVFSSTRIVTTPLDTISKSIPTLLISFARSGNSPESIGAVKIAEMISSRIHHLIITCNAGGELYKWSSDKNNAFTLCLDEKTNDKGLAMTASFSNMLIASHTLAYLFKYSEYSSLLPGIIKGGENLLQSAPDIVEEVCELDFNRAVFLGNGSHFGTAIESHLKLQELTSGTVMCAYDTFLGLRHGPEALINDRTLVVAYLSNDRLLRRYEEDLLRELKEKKIGLAVLACGNRVDQPAKDFVDYAIEYDPDAALNLPDDLTPPVCIITGQLLGLYKSLDLGFKPDVPSEDGVINRVVKGVKVYNPLSYQKEDSIDVIAER